MRDIQAQSSSQGVNYDTIFVDGSLHQIRRRIITLHVVLITREPQPGFFKAAYIMNGNLHLRFSGSMENVRTCPTPYLTPPDGILCVAGSGKSILWFVVPFLFLLKMTDFVYRLPVLLSSKISKSCAMPIKLRWLISISTFGTSANNTGVTSSLPFSPNFPHAQVPVATFYHAFISITTAARDSLLMTL